MKILVQAQRFTEISMGTAGERDHWTTMLS